MTRISCADCKLWVVDVKKGEFTTRGSGENAKRIARPAGIPTPCHECPKESPANEPNCTLSKDNSDLLALYYKMDARNWQGLSPACLDEVNADMLAIIKRVVDSSKARQNADLLASRLAPLLLGGTK